MNEVEKENLYLVIFIFYGILLYDPMLYLVIVSCWTVYEIGYFFVDYLLSIGKQYAALVKYENDYNKKIKNEAQDP